jgi:chaperone required for assembly of F1-ATPase
VTRDIGHVRQPEQSLGALRASVAGMSDFQLAAMSNAVIVLGSIVLAFAVRDHAFDLETAWQASIVDEMFQAERWGEDAEAAGSRAGRRAELEVAAAMLSLLDRPHD